MAGESAREIARRRREKAERLTRVADAYEKGAEGERQTAQALAMLPVSGWFVIHDVRWPGRRFANIDHIVIGPGGVFVIDSKAWGGRVEVRDGVLRQNGYRREPAVAEAAEAAMAVAGQVPGLDPYAVRPVLCFVGDHPIEGWARDVMLCTPQNLVAMLVSRPHVMDAAEVRRTLVGLQQTLAAAASTPPPATPSPPQSSRVVAPWGFPISRRKSRVGVRLAKLLVGLVLVVGGYVALGGILRHANEIGRALTPTLPATSSGANQRHLRALGASQALPAATGRPPLRVSATSVRTVHRIGTSPYLVDGNRFFGVRFKIVNQGKRVWVSQPGTTYQVAGESVSPHSGGSAIRIREGRVLPDPIRLPPGHHVTGYVVFQVPMGQPITSVSLSVGPGKSKTVSWRIDHQ